MEGEWQEVVGRRGKEGFGIVEGTLIRFISLAR